MKKGESTMHGDPPVSSTELEQLCANCNAAPGTEQWAGELDAINVARNPQWVKRWCRPCCARAQLAYAEKIAAHIPALREELGLLASSAQPTPPQTLRRGLAILLDRLYGLHLRPGHIDAVLDVVNLHAPVKVALASAQPTPDANKETK